MREDTAETPKPGRDLGKMFDLDRTTLIKTFVDRMESIMRDAKTAADDLKQVVADAREAEFAVRDVAAMKSIAKLRLEDKKGAAQEKLEAMERIGQAVDFDVFDWTAVRKKKAPK
jgi:uncharacterized protein (UPF0335 family)